MKKTFFKLQIIGHLQNYLGEAQENKTRETVYFKTWALSYYYFLCFNQSKVRILMFWKWPVDSKLLTYACTIISQLKEFVDLYLPVSGFSFLFGWWPWVHLPSFFCFGVPFLIQNVFMINTVFSYYLQNASNLAAIKFILNF